MSRQNRILIGTSGWSYKHWQGNFYESGGKSKDYLAAYVQHFPTAEINNTFYRLPGKSAVKEWHDTAPDDFRFAVKASRFMTHMKKLKDPEEPISRMLESVAGLGDKLGPFLVQLPPNWRKNRDRLAAFLDALPEQHHFAFEFRDRSWYDDDIYDLLRSRGSALCIYDQEGESTPQEITANWTYVRFHKPHGENNWHYDGESLARWADSFASWAQSGLAVYCYFNNDLDGAAPRNARQMIDLMKERSPDLVEVV